MRIAYIIIAHKNPTQLERLIRKMNNPNFDFYIHIDKKVNIDSFLYLKKIENVYFIRERKECNWGGYSTLLAMTGALTEVVNNDVHYGFYNLLSAQDYPIKSNEVIYNFFKKNPEKSYIYYEDANTDIWWEGARNRFQKYHLTDYNFRGKFILENLLNFLLPKRRFPFEGVLYGGSKASWWSLNSDCAKYLSDFFVNKLDFHCFLKYCWGTDEFVIPTILVNSILNDNIINNNLRYIDFPPGSANPRILEESDLPELLKSEMLFARKFDLGISDRVLDEIDKRTC